MPSMTARKSSRLSVKRRTGSASSGAHSAVLPSKSASMSSRHCGELGEARGPRRIAVGDVVDGAAERVDGVHGLARGRGSMRMPR